MIKVMETMESLPLSLNTDGQRTALLQRCIDPLRAGVFPSSLKPCLIAWLMGAFYIKWNPFWTQLKTAMSTVSALETESCWKWMSVAVKIIDGYCDAEGVPYEEQITMEEDKELLKDHESEDGHNKNAGDDNDTHDEEFWFTRRCNQSLRYGVWCVARSLEMESAVDISYE